MGIEDSPKSENELREIALECFKKECYASYMCMNSVGRFSPRDVESAKDDFRFFFLGFLSGLKVNS